MTEPLSHGEWCRRLDEAVVDGRFAEDPAHWQAHLQSCSRCRETAEGYAVLRRLIELSRPDETKAVAPRPGSEPAQAVAAAFGRYRRHRRSRFMLLGAAGLAVCGAGGWMLTRDRAPQAAVATDEVAEGLRYARYLVSQVPAGGGNAWRDRLIREPALEREFRAALRHRSSAVRRTAYSFLSLAGRPVPLEETLRLLREARPGLEGPLTLASADDASRHLAEALEGGRTRLLVSVLSGLGPTLMQSGEKVPIEVLLPYLDDPDAEVRASTLKAIGAATSGAPRERLERSLTSDPEPRVRIAAAEAILKFEGEAGKEWLADDLGRRSDPEVERKIAWKLGSGPVAMQLAMRRIQDPAGFEDIALLHAMRVQDAGLPLDPDRIVGMGIRGNDHAAYRCVNLAVAGDWSQHREALQARWRATTEGGYRGPMGSALVKWDVASGDRRRFDMCLEILEEGWQHNLDDALKVLREHADPSVRERAEKVAAAWAAKR